MILFVQFNKISILCRYTPTSAGTLHVKDASPDDSYARFYCQTIHKLTGERRLSLPGQVIVTGNVDD